MWLNFYAKLVGCGYAMTWMSRAQHKGLGAYIKITRTIFTLESSLQGSHADTDGRDIPFQKRAWLSGFSYTWMSQGGIVIALTSLSTNFIQKVHARIKKDLTCILYRKVHMDWVRRSIQAICYNKKWKVLERSNAWWGAGSNSSAGSSLHRARKCVRLWTTILCWGVLLMGHTAKTMRLPGA